MASPWMDKDCYGCARFCKDCAKFLTWEKKMGIGEQHEFEKTGRIETGRERERLNRIMGDSRIDPAFTIEQQFELFYRHVAKELELSNPSHARLDIVGKLELVKEIIKLSRGESNISDCDVLSTATHLLSKGTNPIHKEFYDLITQIVDTFERKNHDYAGSDAQDMMQNFMRCENYGISMSDGIITRMSDKITRMENLFRNKNQMVHDESLIDTVTDLSVYCLFLVIALKREAKNEE